ncbi:MAG: hypothetical protein WC869_17070 [Phycisphaerae bacterium]
MTYTGLSALTKAVLDLPGKFLKAKKSAMGSVGWLVMSELRNHVEYGPSEWQGLHALTKAYHKKGGGKWILRRSAPHSPASWLGKFARYRTSLSGNTVQIDFGKGKAKGKLPGLVDPQLSAIARRVDGGEKIAVTAKMRRKWAATLARASGRGSSPVLGVNFFPLKKSTQTIEIPARPIFAPVFRKISPQVSQFFETKFWASYYGAKRI